MPEFLPAQMAKELTGSSSAGNQPMRLIAGSQLNYGPQAKSDEKRALASEDSTVSPLESKPWAIFKSAQWSPDGTTIITSNADNVLNTFILFGPSDLLENPGPHALQQYASQSLPAPAYAVAISPSYSNSEPQSALFLASIASLPVRLLSPFTPNIVASYPLVNQQTEAYIAPHSLLFDTYGTSGTFFFAGSDSQISVFDLSRPGEGPCQRMKTIPSLRKKIVGGGVGMKGIVSSLAMSHDGILAASTFSRWIGLYDGGGRGGTQGVFELGKNERDEAEIGEGSGITQVIWSQCGRYLCVAERASDGVSVWDIRGTGKRLCWLKGRKARTMQRLDVDLYGGTFWAGGKDGLVRLWEGIGMREGDLEPDSTFMAHEDVVSSVKMHPCGTILATCSGQRHDNCSTKSKAGPVRINHVETNSESEIDSDSDAGGSDGGSSSSESLDERRKDCSLRIWML